DELVLRLLDLEAEAGEDFVDRRQLIILVFAVAVSVWKRVASGTLIEAHLVDVAGKRGLGDVKAAANELAAQLILAGDGGGSHQVANRVVTVVFGQDELAEWNSLRASLHKDAISCINIHEEPVKSRE